MDPSEFHAKLGDITRIAEVSLGSLSCIGQQFWDLCDRQVIIEAAISLFVI